MRQKKTRGLWLIPVCILAAVCLAGCGSKKDIQVPDTDEQAMGRYLETDIPLPENTRQAYDLVKTEDGSILLSTVSSESSAAVWKLDGDETSWEKMYDLTIEGEGYKTYYISLELSPEGKGVAVAELYQEEGDSEILYYSFDGSGQKTAIPCKPESYPFFQHVDRAGAYYTLESESGISRLNTETGEKEIIVSNEVQPAFFGLVGNTLYAVSDNEEITVYDTDSGEILPADEALNAAVKESGMDIRLKSTSSMPLVFTDAGEEDIMFFCGSAGVFRHSKNGSITEKLVEGSLTDLGKPEIGFRALEVTEDETIYVLSVDPEGSHVLKYQYSSDVSTVPEKKLRAYSLYDNPELQQAITMYQKENPDVYITLETGMSEESSMTASDVLRTLSTEIMAGEGPDLLMMDGMPIDSYIEKGILLDISDIVDRVEQKEGLFTNITSAFKEEDGDMYAVPLRFHMPVLQGQKESLDNVRDLKTLADEAERLHRENPDKYVITPYQNGIFMATQLYDACSAAWVNPDGTVNEEALAEFYTQLNRICSLNVPPEPMDEKYNYGTFGYIQSAGGIGSGILDMYSDKSSLNFGNISSLWNLQDLGTTLTDRENISYGILNGQTENSFLPGCIAGISSKSAETEEISDFLYFLLEEAAQSVNQANGMPVNRQAMEEMVLNDNSETGTKSSSYANDPDSEMIMTTKNLSAENGQMFLDMVEQLENPSLSNEVIREAVLEQANDCTAGKFSVEEIVKNVVDKVNLYLAEG